MPKPKIEIESDFIKQYKRQFGELNERSNMNDEPRDIEIICRQCERVLTEEETIKCGDSATIKCGRCTTIDCGNSTMIDCEGDECVIVRRDIYEVIEPKRGQTIKTREFSVRGYEVID